MAISGTVRDAGDNLSSRLVRVYRRDTGELVGQTLSDETTGAYSVSTTDASEYFAVAHDSVGDPLDNFVQLRLCMDTTASGTTYVDDKGHTVTNTNVVGAASPAHFGLPVALFNGTSSQLSIADSSDTRIGTGDFAIDGWFNMAAYPPAGGFFCVASKYVSGNSRWLLYLGQSIPDDSGLKFVFGNGAAVVNVGHADQTATLASLGVTTNTEHYYKVSRVGGLVTLELNGSTLAKTQSANAYDLSYATGPVVIGAQNGAGFFNGTMSGFRQTSGVGRTTLTDPIQGVPTTPFRKEFGGTENAVILDRITPT